MSTPIEINAKFKIKFNPKGNSTIETFEYYNLSISELVNIMENCIENKFLKIDEITLTNITNELPF